jgi:IclR family KDG regulon transcriptional repressor
VAENGYAVDLGEHIEDVRSVAVPIRDYTRAMVGSLAISGPAYRLSQERIEKEVVPLMLKAGRELSTRLGFESSQ